MPLIDYDDDALSCCIYGFLKRFPWARYGLKVKSESRDDGTESLKLFWVNDDVLLGQSRIPNKLLVHINLLSSNGDGSGICIITVLS